MRMLVTILLISSWAKANVVGSDIQNFNPTTSGLDFVTVHSPMTLDPGIFNFGFFINYAVNTMPNYEDVNTGDRTNFSDTLLGGDINFGLGIMPNWDFGMSFPQVYAQESDDDKNVFAGEISETGLTEYRFNTKYSFWSKDDRGAALVASMNINQVENNPFTGEDPGPTFNLEAVYGFKWRDFYWGINGGYRWRDPGERLAGIPVEPFDDQWIWSIAGSRYLEKWDLKLIAEVFGSFPATNQELSTDRDISTTEILLGVKRDLKHNIAVHAGGGTEIYHGSSSPDWRIYTGINWNLGPLWRRGATDGPKELHPDVTYFGTKPFGTTETFVGGNVLFAHDSDQITPEFEAVLLDLAKYLLSPPGIKKVTVVGHTDSVGPDEYNLDLSIRRSQSVMKVLIEKGGIPKEKVDAAGFGEQRPIADNSNYQGRAKNRRVEFNVTR